MKIVGVAANLDEAALRQLAKLSPSHKFVAGDLSAVEVDGAGVLLPSADNCDNARDLEQLKHRPSISVHRLIAVIEGNQNGLVWKRPCASLVGQDVVDRNKMETVVPQPIDLADKHRRGYGVTRYQRISRFGDFVVAEDCEFFLRRQCRRSAGRSHRKHHPTHKDKEARPAASQHPAIPTSKKRQSSRSIRARRE